MSKWTHSVCDDCWNKRKPGKEPRRLVAREFRKCCACEYFHRSGILIRDDLKAMPCRGEHEDKSPEIRMAEELFNRVEKLLKQMSNETRSPADAGVVLASAVRALLVAHGDKEGGSRTLDEITRIFLQLDQQYVEEEASRRVM